MVRASTKPGEPLGSGTATEHPTLGKLKSVSEFLFDLVKAFEKVRFVEAIAQAVPWAGLIGESIAEAAPPIKFLVSFFHKLVQEHDPDRLAHIACTVAYQRSAEQALRTIQPLSTLPRAQRGGVEHRPAAELPAAIEFSTFSFATALEHPFVTQADAALGAAADTLGYSKADRRKLINEVHVRFVGNLKNVLAHGKTREKFKPFMDRMVLDTREEQAYAALYEHADYQRRQFEEMPVLRSEPFALSDIYVDTDCGKLNWEDLSRPTERVMREELEAREPVDPFREKCGGRHPLVKTVMDLIGEASFKDAIVVQGVAGSGKSTFTLRLAAELIRQGLRPIRVRFRDLRLDVHVKDALPQAVRFYPEGEDPERARLARAEDIFLDGDIFNDSLQFGTSTICPWVLILDGWDEVNISVSEGFKIRVDRLLEQIRSEYVDRRGTPIRVILTGRPSTAVTESKFLRGRTPILTLRPLTPDQLRQFVAGVDGALKSRPLSGVANPATAWSIPDLKRFQRVFERYDHDFKEGAGSMEVLGLPLLTHLAVRLISRWTGEVEALIENPTTLYRSLVDLTCEKAGKAPEEADTAEGMARITGRQLRRLLRETAAAMTACGAESISFGELSKRLRRQGEELLTQCDGAAEEHVLVALMVSFFFKGGQKHLGAEFVHKSFREYLFAEQIVEAIKDHARESTVDVRERAPYWKDFEASSPQYALSRRLSDLLAPQWLSPEVARHVKHLLRWEIGRSAAPETAPSPGRPTEPLDSCGWERARNLLADIWDWWAEGVHLRPEPKMETRGFVGFSEPLVCKMIDWSSPQEVQQEFPAPARTATIDAHLGDGLFQLAASVHYQTAIAAGWLEKGKIKPGDLWEGVSDMGHGPRRCQCSVRRADKQWTLFSPAGANPGYFVNYIARVNSAGWRPMGWFPIGLDLSGVDLRQVHLAIPIQPEAPRYHTTWTHANLSDACAYGTLFFYDNLSFVFAHGLKGYLGFFQHANLLGSDFGGAHLGSADLSHANAEDTNFVEAKLASANFTDARLSDSSRELVSRGGAIFDRKSPGRGEQVRRSQAKGETENPP